MFNDDTFKFCFEAREVTKIVEVAVLLPRWGESLVRIEAVKDLRSGKYSANVFLYQEVQLKTISAGTLNSHRDHTQLIEFPQFPPVLSKDTEEQALRSALSFLHDRCKKE